MKALRFYAPEDVRLEEVPEPQCGPDEIKLRVRNCSTCGTDVKIRANRMGLGVIPLIMGHEASLVYCPHGPHLTAKASGTATVIARCSRRLMDPNFKDTTAGRTHNWTAWNHINSKKGDHPGSPFCTK